MNNPWYDEISGETYYPSSGGRLDARLAQIQQQLQRQQQPTPEQAMLQQLQQGQQNILEVHRQVQRPRESLAEGVARAVFFAWLGGRIGHAVGSKWERKRESKIAPSRARAAAQKERYVQAYQAWDSEYGDTHRADLPCPPPPTYQSVAQ